MVSLRVKLKDRGRRVSQVWLLDADRATRLRPGEPGYLAATQLIGLGRRRQGKGRKGG